MSNNSPKEKTLRATSFVIHATRGMVRDQRTRRKTMLVVLVLAFVLLFSGSTFLQSALNPRGHPGWFVLFWVLCGWLTLTAILLALFDLLLVKLEARKTERILRQKFLQSANRDSPRSTSGE